MSALPESGAASEEVASRTPPRGGRCSSGRAAALGLVTSLVVGLACVSAPLREQGGDTVPGRLGMVVLACDGGWHLDGVEWLARLAGRGRTPYFVNPTPDSRHLVSTFGPGPALLGWPAALSLTPGQRVSDRELSARARVAAAFAVALAAGLLSFALVFSTRRLSATFGGLLAGLSFAGAASLGQGLWQQTAALLPLVLALALHLASRRREELAILVPGFAALAAFARPADALLAFALALAAFWTLKGSARRGQRVGVALFFVLGVLVRPLLWDQAYLGQLLPLGQLAVNRAAGHGAAFDFGATHLGTGLAGLLVSPSRGLVFFAPAALFGVVQAIRGRDPIERLLVAGVVLQLAVVVAFHKWWGGACFGPRLLAGAVWVSIALAFGARQGPQAGALRVLVSLSLITLVVGLLGLTRYDPRLFELRREVDAHPARLFDVGDSALSALFREAPEGRLFAAPQGPFIYCDDVPLRAAPGE